jgi:uncharacterized membrane protein
MRRDEENLREWQRQMLERQEEMPGPRSEEKRFGQASTDSADDGYSVGSELRRIRQQRQAEAARTGQSYDGYVTGSGAGSDVGETATDHDAKADERRGGRGLLAFWRPAWNAHLGKIFGVATAVILGILYFIVGFWDMLFFALLLAIGYTIGARKDRGEGPLFDVRRLWDGFVNWIGNWRK